MKQNEPRVTRQERAKRELSRSIKKGDYLPGDRLPSLAELAGSMGLKIMPVRKAVEALVDDGIVYTINGKGTFVCKQGVKQGVIAVVAHNRDQLPARGERLGWFINASIYQGICASLRERKREHKLFYLNEYSANGQAAWRSRFFDSNCRGCIVLGELPENEMHNLRVVMGAHRIVSTDFSDFPESRNEIKLRIETGLQVILQKALDYGHRKIAFLYSDKINDVWTHMERYRVCMKFFQQHDIIIRPRCLIETGGSSLDGYRAASLLLERIPDVSLIIAATDNCAKGVIHAIEDSNILVGQDISVIGFDDMPEAEELNLATVHMPLEAIGRESVDLLDRCVRNKLTSQRVWVDTIPMLRDSLRPVA
jgi:DNA-binding LacI/PurR family transcriptional regulator